MTVSNQNYKVGPTTGVGSIATYNYPYRVDADSHLVVVETVIATNVDTVLTQGVDYTLSGSGPPYLSGVNVTLTAGNLPATKTITIYRNTPLSQEVDIGAQEDLPEESIELALDRGVLLLQELSGDQERNLKLPVTTDLGAVSTEIPPPEANKFLAGKPDASGWRNVEASTLAELTLPSMTGKDEYPLLVDETGSTIQYGTNALGALAYLGTVDTAQIEDDAITAAKLADTTVSAGSYTNADITVDAQGRVTAASNGSAAEISSSYTSSEQTITPAGSLTLAHGLGAQPKIITAKLVCKTAEYNYSVNDEVYIDAGGMHLVGSTVLPRGMSLTIDSTNINVRFGNQVNTFNIFDATTGNAAGITTANWKLVIGAYA